MLFKYGSCHTRALFSSGKLHRLVFALLAIRKRVAVTNDTIRDLSEFLLSGRGYTIFALPPPVVPLLCLLLFLRLLCRYLIWRVCKTVLIFLAKKRHDTNFSGNNTRAMVHLLHIALKRNAVYKARNRLVPPSSRLLCANIQSSVEVGIVLTANA